MDKLKIPVSTASTYPKAFLLAAVLVVGGGGLVSSSAPDDVAAAIPSPPSTGVVAAAQTSTPPESLWDKVPWEDYSMVLILILVLWFVGNKITNILTNIAGRLIVSFDSSAEAHNKAIEKVSEGIERMSSNMDRMERRVMGGIHDNGLTLAIISRAVAEGADIDHVKRMLKDLRGDGGEG